MARSIEQPDFSRRPDEPLMFDLWVRRTLKEQWGQVAREKVPDELLALLDERPTAH